MSASDHVSPYIKAYHISWNETPPHELAPLPDIYYSHGYYGGNTHPDIIHMGTRRSAVQIHRTHLHEYEIDPSKMYPIVYSDEFDAVTDSGNNRDFNKAMAGKQEGLWESEIPDVHKVVSRKQVTPYRNRVEDPGSISYMVPKAAIQSGAVRYKGVTDLTERTSATRTKRDEIEEAEKLYRYAED